MKKLKKVASVGLLGLALVLAGCGDKPAQSSSSATSTPSSSAETSQPVSSAEVDFAALAVKAINKIAPTLSAAANPGLNGNLALTTEAIVQDEEGENNYTFQIIYSVPSDYADFLAISEDGKTLLVTNPTTAVGDKAGKIVATAKREGVTYTEQAREFNILVKATDIIPISAIYTKEKGDTVSFYGKVTGTYGPTIKNGIYVENGEYGILVFNTSTWPEGINIGSYVSVTGTVSPYSGLYEVNNASWSLLDDTKKTQVAEPVVTTIDKDNIVKMKTENESRYFKVKDATIGAVDYVESKGRLTVNVKVGEEVYTVYNDSKAYTENMESWWHTREGEESPSIPKAGDIVSFEAFSSCYNTFQFVDVKCTAWEEGEEPEPEPEPEMQTKSIAYAKTCSSSTAANKGEVHKYVGVIENVTPSGTKANAYITDPATGDCVYIYGLYMTGNYNWNGTTKTWSCTDYADAGTTALNGKTVTIIGTLDFFNVPELKNVVVQTPIPEVVTTGLTASAEAVEHATVTLGKTENITYGEDVTVTVEPESGYSVQSVKVGNAYSSTQSDAEPVTGQTNVYSFKATAKNVVTVAVVQGGPVEPPAMDSVSVADVLGSTGAGVGYYGKVVKIENVLIDNIYKPDYGNAYGVDTATGKAVTLYGTYTSGTTAYDWENTKWTYTPGTTVIDETYSGKTCTVIGEVSAFSNVGQLKNAFVSVKGETTKSGLTASLKTVEHGTAVLSKTADITHGDEITVTVTPDAGYVVEGVKANTAFGSVTADAVTGQENVFSFKASFVNEVEVTIAESFNGLKINADNLKVGSSYGDCSATIGGVAVAGTQLMKTADGNKSIIQINNKTKTGVHNTAATTKAIKSITITFNATKQTNNGNIAKIYTVFGTSAQGDATSGTNLVNEAGVLTYTVNCDVANATFFKVGHGTTSGACYIESIVVAYVD